MLIPTHKTVCWDQRRDLIVPGDFLTTIAFCRQHWITLCKQAIQERGAFFVALSGGSTPKAIFEGITSPPNAADIDWSKVHLFWSDERAAPPDDPSSNYHMAMQAGFSRMPIPSSQIHRMHAEENIEENALRYEQQIQGALQGRPFDLIMLGVGEDGHTASLFPGTPALDTQGRLVVANFAASQNSWRMTFTFLCINQAAHIALYVLGAGKKHILSQILQAKEDRFPACRVGTSQNHALWIADEAAAEEINRFFS